MRIWWICEKTRADLENADLADLQKNACGFESADLVDLADLKSHHGKTSARNARPHTNKIQKTPLRVQSCARELTE